MQRTADRTPPAELPGFDPTARFRLLAEPEALDPGGSTKDRSGLELLRGAINEGRVSSGRSAVAEPGSGDQGIGPTRAYG
ncbi:hypothetical protein [Streptomyces sp. NPDC006309]|uniref:hypothetical protein n=1 Tax=Streptomyces sp. NPDC006309 TaxID=3156749 RepID=UPI0033B90857